MIPLAELDDWLDFAEALLGTHDVPAELAGFGCSTRSTSWSSTRTSCPDWMGMDRSYWLESRFPWVGVREDIAGQQGFFHWELEFAQVFGGGVGLICRWGTRLGFGRMGRGLGPR